MTLQYGYVVCHILIPAEPISSVSKSSPRLKKKTETEPNLDHKKLDQRSWFMAIFRKPGSWFRGFIQKHRTEKDQFKPVQTRLTAGANHREILINIFTQIY
jgi:hypothetical protein